MRHLTPFTIAGVFLSVAVIFGGGGTASPATELTVQLAALAALAAYALTPARSAPPPVPDRTFTIAVAALVAVPVIQLIPLPPAIWHALPGRDTTIAALRLINADQRWRPISLAPFATFASVLSFIPPLVMLFLVRRLTNGQRSRLLAWMTGLALLAATLGVIQLGGAQAAWLRFYPGQSPEFATGFQGNRNSSADVLLIGLLSLAAAIAAQPHLLATTAMRLVAGSAGIFLILSIVLTGSRAGTALIPVALIFGALMFRPRLGGSRNVLIGAIALLVVGGIAAAVLQDNPAIRRTFARYETQRDQRPDLWTDTSAAINRFWPVGAGVGTFATVFPAFERLDVVDDSRPVRAHQDYLEYALEAGLAGLLLLAALGAALGARVIAIYRTGTDPAGWTLAICAVGVATVIAMHALVDYPLRSMSLATVCAMIVGMVSRPVVAANEHRRRRRSSARRFART